jgi:hypothetical protein
MADRKKILTAIILNDLKKKFKNNDSIKDFLIDCIDRNGLIENPEEIEVFEEPGKVTTKCLNCGYNIFEINEDGRTCKNCGATTRDIMANPNRGYKESQGRGTLLQPGNVRVKIKKDGRDIFVDLANISKWTDSKKEDQPLLNHIKQINDLLDKLSEVYNNLELATSFDEASKLAISMWYNIFITKNRVKGPEKLSLLAWCINFSFLYYKIDITITELSSLLNVQFGTIKSYLQSFKDIFKRSAFEKYIIKSEEELVIPPTLKYGLKLATKHLVDNRVVKQPIKKIEKFGILYYLANVYNINEYTLEFLAENSNLEPLEITKMYTNILKFYKSNPSLKEELDVQ